MTSKMKFIEECFIVGSLLLFTGGPIELLVSGGASDESFQEASSPIEQLVFLLIQGIALVGLWLRRKQLGVKQVRNRLALISLLVLLAIVTASILWSQFPYVTARRSLALIGTTVFGLYLTSSFDSNQQASFLSKAFGCAMILSLIFAILLPQYGLMGAIHTGAWRGIYIHKNGLGSVMTISAIFFLVQVLGKDKKRLLYGLGLLGSLLLLLLSGSKSALLIFLGLVIILCLYTSLKLNYELMLPVVLGLVLIMSGLGSLLFDNIETILNSIGKDPTLTGRTDMWPYIFDSIAKRPWLGYGYSSFWEGLDSEAAPIWYAIGWQPTHPHNGLLQLLLMIGIFGTASFLFTLTIGYTSSLLLIRETRKIVHCWPALFLTYTILTNISETRVLEYNRISWVLFVTSVLYNPQQSGRVGNVFSKDASPHSTRSYYGHSPSAFSTKF
jgi:exopolysaccharide production protein ExoQ